MDQRGGLCVVREDRAGELSRITALVAASNFRIKQARIKPDLIFNLSGSVSVSFIVLFGSTADLSDEQWTRIAELGRTSLHSYVIAVSGSDISLNSLEYAQRSRGRVVLGKPPAIFVDSSSTAAEKMLRLALVTSESKLSGRKEALIAENEDDVCSRGSIKRILAGIPGINSFTADKLLSSVGCVKDIAKASTNGLIRAGLKEETAEDVHDFFLAL